MPKRKKVADPREDEDTLSVEQSRIKHTEMLNSSFFRWVQNQHMDHQSEFWRNGLEEYLQYGREIQAKFPVAADSQADAPKASDLSGTARPPKSQKPAALPALSGPSPASNILSTPYSPFPPIRPVTAPHGSTAPAAMPSITAAAGTTQAPQPLFGFSAPASPAAFNIGAKPSAADSTDPKSTAPKQPPLFSFGGAASTTAAFPLTSSGQDKQPTPNLSNHHVLPSNTEGVGTSGTPVTTLPTTAAAASEPEAGLAAASSISAPLPSLSTSTPPPTSAAQSLPFGASQPPSLSVPIFGAPTTPSADKLPSVSASQPASMGSGAAPFPFGASAAASSQSASAASTSPLPFAFGSGQSSASTSMAFGASQAPNFGAPAASTAAAASSQFAALFSFSLPPPQSLGSAAAFASSQSAAGSSQLAFGSSQPAFGSSSPATGSGLPLFGSSQPAFDPPLSAAGANQSAPSSTAPMFALGASQPAIFGPGADPSAATAGGAPVFHWGAPASSPIAGTSGAAANGSGPAQGLFGTGAAPFSFGGASGQTGAAASGPAFGAPAAQSNGMQEEDEQAEPEEAVVYEKAEGVLLSQEVKWRHNVNGKWDKIRQGKVLVCQPPGTAKPYLQFQTSGQVVATAYAQTALTQKSPPSKLLGALAMSFRHVDKSGEESCDDPKVLPTLIDCASADAAKELADKVPAPKKA